MELLKEHHHILKAIKDVAEEQAIKNFDITDVTTNPKGEGYMGLFFLVTIKDKVTEKQLELATKGAFTDENIRKMVPVQTFFNNEITFYSKIYKQFKQFEENHQVSQKTELVPRCFKVSSEPLRELLILENLKLSGFDIFDKRNFLNQEQISLIFQTYGRFHAYSFALRDQKPEDFEKLAKSLSKEVIQRFKTENSVLRQQIKVCGKLIQSYLIPGEDDEIINIYKKAYENDGIVNIFGTILEGKCKNKSILHGDCWSNNIMFKYKNTSKNRKLEDIRLIDFQLTRVGNPVCDLSYCFYSGAAKEDLDKLDMYLQIYYKSFSTFLEELGSNPQKVFPFEALKADWKEYSKSGMIIGFSVLKNKMTSAEETVDLSDGSDITELTNLFKNVKFDEERYKKTVRELLHHMIEINAL